MFAISPDKCRIGFESVGTGRPMVFLHGLGDCRLSWLESGHVDAALAAGRRVILMDARGHGDSDKPHDPALYALPRMAADVVAVLDELDVAQADLVGFSMGGGIALATALYFAERVGRFAMIGAHCYAQSMMPFRKALDAGTEGLVQRIEANGLTLPEPVRQRMLANDVNALRAVVAEDRPDRSALLSVLTRPLIAIAGTEDPSFDPMRKMAARAGGAFAALEGRNHFTSFLAVEEIIGAVLRFFEPRQASAPAAAEAGA